MSEARFIVGIDLGTSNSALAYAEIDEVRKKARPIIRELEIPQLVALGDVQGRTILPSTLYTPAAFELAEGQASLPWRSEDADASRRPYAIIGEAAKRLGAKTPVRLIKSAKSWLCHAGVNRTAPILPWHAPDDIPKMSPVDASAAFLAHLRDAWNFAMAGADPSLALEHQFVVVTVPASFDEIARRLTLEAAKRARFGAITLIEEPLAAFYAFVARTGGTTRTTGLSHGERVLVADVGGGTTDFTLIDVRSKENGDDGMLEFERTAVGDHLLLGGDNMDLALAHALEGDLEKSKKLDAELWAQLELESRLAKEVLFTHPDRASLPIVLTGRGSKLVGGTLRAELTRERLHAIVLDGYFPALPAGSDALPQRTPPSAGFSEVGLPYAKDPRITRHLAAFLMRHARHGEPFARVDAILFNGGALEPTLVRDRVSRVVGDWMRKTITGAVRDPRPLVFDDADSALQLAVARGAAYFGLTQFGLGLRVGGGSPREYFLGLGVEDGAALAVRHVQVVCVAPRGMQDGQCIELSDREFALVTNRPVQFPLYSTTSPRHDAVGALVTIDEAELTKLPPLQTVVKFGKHQAGTKIPVRIQAKRTELGTLELACLSKMSGARFTLEFDLRADASNETNTPVSESSRAEGHAHASPFGGAGSRLPPEAAEIAPARLDAAKQRIVATFQSESPRLDPDLLMKGLESDLGLGRDSFPLPVLRALAEHLLELSDCRAISAEIEMRWMNVTGFCLRPGYGVPVDDWRVRQLWKIHARGTLHPTHDPCELNWWILWRRVAGGLSRGHQEELSSVVFPLVIPGLAKRAKRKPPRSTSELAVEMWRAAASLEQIGAKARAQLGDALVGLIEERHAPKTALWCLGRIGARKLLYGPREATVRASTIAEWTTRLLKLERLPKDEAPLPCFISLARLTGDRQFDLDEGTRRAIASELEKRGAKPEQLEPLFEVVRVDSATESRAFGEGLPVGLHATQDLEPVGDGSSIAGP